MWVAGIARFAGKLGLVFQDKDGVVTEGATGDMVSELPCANISKLRALIQFNEFSLVPTKEYLAAIGLPHLCDAGQQCYEFQTAEGPVVVAGQSLVVALMGATTHMRAPLLSPQGPTALMTAFEDGEMVFEPTPKRMRQFQTERLSTVYRMQWVLTYPSARRAWSSIYINACRGVLDLTLPRAAGMAALRGVMAEGKLWVTGIALLTLAPNEAPFEFAESQPPRGGGWDLLMPTATQKRLTPDLHGVALPPLTDSQWSSLKIQLGELGIHVSRKKQILELRDKVEIARKHLSSGVSGYRLPGSQILLRATVNWIRRLQAKGLWPEVQAALGGTLHTS